MHRIHNTPTAIVILLMVVVLYGAQCLGADNLDSLLSSVEETDGFQPVHSSIVFNRTHIVLDRDGGRREFRELLYHFSNGDNHPLLRFDSERDTLIVEAARWRSSGKEWTNLTASDVSVSTIPEAIWAFAYARLKEVQVSFPLLQGKSDAYLRYRIESKASPHRRVSLNYGDVVLFGSHEPIGEMSYEIEVAAGRDFSYEMLNEAFDPEITPNDSASVYRWRRTDLPPIPRDLNTADLSYFVPTLCWTTFPDWEALGLDISERFWESVDASQQAVDEWSRITSPELWGIPAMMNAARFVTQRVRSVQIPPTMIGYEPLSADHVWENLYANSMDKAVLLTAIARAYGYDAIPVLVLGAPEPFSLLPVLEQFRHVIVAVSTGEDTLWFDPMARFHPPGTLPATDSYGMGCMMVGGAPLLLPVPISAQETRTEIRVSMSGQGNLEGTLSYFPQGDFAAVIRSELAGLSSSELERFTATAIYEWSSEAQMTNFRISNMADFSEPVTMEFRFTRTDYAKETKRQMSVAIPPSPFDPVRAQLLSLPAEVAYPIKLPPPCRAIRTFSLTIPDGWRVSSLSPPLLIDNPLLRIEIITRLNETVLNWMEIIEIKCDFVPVASYDDVRASFLTSLQQQYQEIVLEQE